MSQDVIPRIDVSDTTLFGNDAAEDESQQIFESYFLSRPEIDQFTDVSHRLRILRAYRGEGKSAILRMAFHVIKEKDYIAVRTTGASLAPDVTGSDPSAWTKGWKQAMFSHLASEIGAQIGMAWSDDAMSLVDEAERNGFRARSFTSGVLDRINGLKMPERRVLGTPNAERLLQRWQRGRPKVWLFVDDVDENFANTPEFRAKVAAFFSASRQVMTLVPDIRIRTGVRPNVWRIIRSDAESLSKVDQYAIDIGWDESLLRGVLAKRVEGYLLRTGQDAVLSRFDGMKPAIRDERLVAMAFDEPMEWGFDKEQMKPKYRPPHVVMATLSSHLPRWMIEIAKLAAAHATTSRSVTNAKISKTDIVDVLEGFGRSRIDDLAAEYTSECAQVREIISAFADGAEDYSTAELHTAITNRIMQGTPVTLANCGRVTRPTQIAAFLYEIGFLTAREEGEDGHYVHYTFAQEPDLLHSRTNLDRGMSWEIHPVFRQSLGLRTASGAKIDTRKRYGVR